MIWLLRIKKRSGRTKVFCFKSTARNRKVWAGAKARLDMNPLVAHVSIVPV